MFKNLAKSGTDAYSNYLRVDEDFKELLERIEHPAPGIEKQLTFWRRPIEPGLRLAITLRFLATGDSYKYLIAGLRGEASVVAVFIADGLQLCQTARALMPYRAALV